MQISGPGITCAKTPFDFDPDNLIGEEDRFADWSATSRRAIFPITAPETPARRPNRASAQRSLPAGHTIAEDQPIGPLLTQHGIRSFNRTYCCRSDSTYSGAATVVGAGTARRQPISPRLEVCSPQAPTPGWADQGSRPAVWWPLP
ncbi:hypothetical protein AB0F77_10930 [Streptomyces sp. NPDC026672]|uniref:hypothetical protein n=1 Tax=unclassified Streptomyces TaxID=2593676 RepID=UPI00340B9506